MLLLLSSAFTHSSSSVGGARLVDNDAFTYGEELNYRVHYGWINAATIRLKVADTAITIKGRPTYNITGIGKSNKSFDWAYRVRDHFETYLDEKSLAPLKYFKYVQEDEYKDVDLVFYDHENKKLKGKKKDMDIPAYVQDIVSAIYYARTLDLASAKENDVFPFDLYLDQQVYNLSFKYLGTDVLSTEFGKVKCYKLRPQLVVDRVFRDEEDMTLWVSADKNKIPIRVQSKIYVGSLKVDIVSHKGLLNEFESLVD